MSSKSVIARPSPQTTRARAAELARFGATGGVCVFFNVVVIVILTSWLGLNYLISICVCFVGGTVVSFCLNRHWTFKLRAPGATADFVRYVTVATLQLALCLASCDACVELLHIPYVVAVVLLSAAMAPLTFLLHRGFSFQLKWLS